MTERAQRPAVTRALLAPPSHDTPETTMNLGELITALEAADPTLVVAHGFTNPHSYRGDYYDLAFEPADTVSVAAMLDAARSAVGATYTGYKGGEFTMTADTWCWLSAYGDASSETISPLSLRAMLAAPAAVPSAGGHLRDRIRRAICEASGFTWLPDELMEPDEYGEHADAVLAVLPAPAGQPALPLSEVWMVWQEDGPASGHFTDETTAKLAAIEEHKESETPGLEFTYSWNEHGGRLELLADGEDTGLRLARHRVYGKPAEPAEFELRSTTDARAAVLAEAIEVARHESERLATEMSGDAAYGARAVAKMLRRMADEAQPTEPDEQEPVQLRWGLNDVMWGDDDTVTVMLSGPAREPYWLELAPERRDALREALVAPEGDEQQAGEGR